MDKCGSRWVSALPPGLTKSLLLFWNYGSPHASPLLNDTLFEDRIMPFFFFKSSLSTRPIVKTELTWDICIFYLFAKENFSHTKVNRIGRVLTCPLPSCNNNKVRVRPVSCRSPLGLGDIPALWMEVLSRRRSGYQS